MPSESFTRFVRQLHAQGPEKADGFDPRVFDGLLPEERPEVERLLTEALVRGDNTAAEGLVLYDRDRARVLLADALPRVPWETGVGASVAGQLWTLTHDARWQPELVRHLRHPSAPTRLTALGYLEGTPPAPALAPDLAAAIVGEARRTNRSIAGALLLYWLRIVPRPDDAYRQEGPAMAALTDDDPATRRAAVDGVLKRAP